MSTPSVLFVCVHNAGRSQMAAGWLRALAGDAIEVRSAGTAPADQVNPVAVEAMREVGVDIAAATPKVLTTDAVQVSDVVITMGCGDTCPVLPGVTYLDWALPDPAGQGIEAVRPIRDEIRGRVEKLVAELLPADEQVHCGCCGQRKPAGRLTQLGSTPGVHICASCALGAALRIRGIRLERLDPRTWLGRLRPRPEVRDRAILAIPILPSTDLTRTAGFYRRLGFDVVEQLDTYLVMSVDHVELHFIDDDPHLRPGYVFVNVPEVDLVRERLSASGTAGVGPVREQFGLREFLLTDPDGNRIRVGHATGD